MLPGHAPVPVPSTHVPLTLPIGMLQLKLAQQLSSWLTLVLLQKPPVTFMQHGCWLLHGHTPLIGHAVPSQQCSPRVSLHGLPTFTQHPAVILQFNPMQQDEKLPVALAKLHMFEGNLGFAVALQQVPVTLAQGRPPVQQVDTLPSVLLHRVSPGAVHVMLSQ